MEGVVVDAHYGYPHAVVTVRVDPRARLPADLRQAGTDEQLAGVGGGRFLERAEPFDGRGKVELLMPPDMTEAVDGMPDRPGVGERFAAVVAPDCVSDELRAQVLRFADGEYLALPGRLQRAATGCGERGQTSVELAARTNGRTSDPRPAGAPPPATRALAWEERRPPSRSAERRWSWSGTWEASSRCATAFVGGGAPRVRKGGSMDTALRWLEGNSLLEAARSWPWYYPAAEIAHLIGLALLVGSAAMFDLRLLGLSRRIPVTEAAGHLLPWTKAGFAVVVLSGLLLFANDPVGMVANPAFQLKMFLIAAAGINAFAFHVGVFGTVKGWDKESGTPAAAKVAATISLGLWAAIVALGRLIAYV